MKIMGENFIIALGKYLAVLTNQRTIIQTSNRVNDTNLRLN